MKVLFIAPLPPPVTGHSLASSVLLKDLAKYHHVDEINLSKTSFVSGLFSPPRIAEVIKILSKVWRKKKNVHCVYLSISESLAGNIKDLIIYATCARILSKMVIHVHGGSLRKLLFAHNSLVFAVNKYFLRQLGGVVVLGRSHIGDFSDVVPIEKIHVVNNFAEDYLFLDEKEVLRKFETTSPLRILFLSNLIRGKGHNELVDAYLRLSEGVRQNVRLDFAGAFESHRDETAFLRKIERFAGIEYHGIVNGTNKRSLLANAHVLCLPTSLNEGQPICILEAYASGCAVITTTRGGISDVFTNGVNGFEVQANSPDSIRQAIERILEKPDKLLPLAIYNRRVAHAKYRVSRFNTSLTRIIEKIANDQR